MGRYMIVVLRDRYKTETFIEETNKHLIQQFGAPAGVHFVSRQFVQGEADYINTDPKGLKQIPHFSRPVTPETLSNCFFWYRIGEFHAKINSLEQKQALAAIAISKWITQTKGRFIAKIHSMDYKP